VLGHEVHGLQHAYVVLGLEALVAHRGDVEVMASDLTAEYQVPDVALPEALVEHLIPHPLVKGVVGHQDPGIYPHGGIPDNNQTLAMAPSARSAAVGGT